jgi:transposase
MLGTRGPQQGLFDADTMYGEYVGRESFYGFLAQHRAELFQDEEFAQMYCANNGRPSLPPSLLAMALVLQTHDKVSDEEARRRAAFDLQWKVALGVGLEEAPFGKSTLCEFRALLTVHEEQQAIFRKSLKLARQRGYLKKQKKLKVALDTTAIFGRGAVKDTYNMLADGIALVGRRLALGAGETEAAWAEREGYQRYITEPSLKGALDIDWDNRQQRAQALASVVADADRLLEQVRRRRGELEEGSSGDTNLAAAAGVLSRVLAQDIERTEPAPVPAPEVEAEGKNEAGEPGSASVAGAVQRLNRVLEQTLSAPRMARSCARVWRPTGCQPSTTRRRGTGARPSPTVSSGTRPISRWTPTSNSSRRWRSCQVMRRMRSRRWRWLSRQRRTPAARSNRPLPTAPTGQGRPARPSWMPGGP